MRVNVNPGSNYLITYGETDKSTRVWNIVTGQEYRRWPGLFEAAADDRDRVMTHDKDALHVWSITTGKELANVPLPKEPAMFSTLNATFSPDARHILMLQDGVAKVIAIENQETISTIRSEDKTSLLWTNLFASTSPVKFSPDGKYIAVSTMEESWLSLWRPEDMREEACQRVSRNLTQEEWKQYLGDQPYLKTCPQLPLPGIQADENS
jgi:WD40 repeat protein